MIAALYATLMFYAAVAFVWAILGMLNDYGNRYPPWLLASSIIAGSLAVVLLK